jgi:uncharacterized protein
MGMVQDQPTVDDLKCSVAWEVLMKFKEIVDSECGKCRYIKFCRGGCPYNALPETGMIEGVDPHCMAYKTIFKEISKRATKEMMSNIMPSDSEKGNKNGIMSLMIK